MTTAINGNGTFVITDSVAVLSKICALELETDLYKYKLKGNSIEHSRKLVVYKGTERRYDYNSIKRNGKFFNIFATKMFIKSDQNKLDLGKMYYF